MEGACVKGMVGITVIPRVVEKWRGNFSAGSLNNPDEGMNL